MKNKIILIFTILIFTSVLVFSQTINRTLYVITINGINAMADYNHTIRYASIDGVIHITIPRRNNSIINDLYRFRPTSARNSFSADITIGNNSGNESYANGTATRYESQTHVTWSITVRANDGSQVNIYIEHSR